MSVNRITSAMYQSLKITPRTIWHVITLTDAEGRTGYGEATVANENGALYRLSEIVLEFIIECPANPDSLAALPHPSGLVETALFSALDMALSDLAARVEEKSLAKWLGGTIHQTLHFYANINRRCTNRSPESFAEHARHACSQGYDAIKIAPFDEVSVDRCRSENTDELIAPGLARIAAVREAIGPRWRLSIDCHWRFTSTAARRMIDSVSAMSPYWIECPLPEIPETVGETKSLRQQSNRAGILLAGLEKTTDLQTFEPYLDAGAYDIVMPDVKYLGGLSRFRELEAKTRRAGVGISLHNPSGPIAHAVTIHIAAGLKGNSKHELQFDESPIFERLLKNNKPIPRASTVQLPSFHGTGVDINHDFAKSIETARCLAIGSLSG